MLRIGKRDTSNAQESKKASKTLVTRYRTISWWGSRWFNLSHGIVKLLELTLSLTSMIIILSWESRGVRIFSLDEEEGFNYRNVMFFFVSVCSVTLLYTMIMTVFGCLKVKLPSIILSLAAGIILFLWLLANPLLSGTLDVLENSKFVRKRQVDIVALKVASVVGFVVLGVVVVDMLLGFLEMRKSDNKFKNEVNALNPYIDKPKSYTASSQF